MKGGGEREGRGGQRTEGQRMEEKEKEEGLALAGFWKPVPKAGLPCAALAQGEEPSRTST